MLLSSLCGSGACSSYLARQKGKSGLPHAHLVEAVLKHMASPDSQAQAAVASVIVPSRVNARPEVGALVVKLYEARHLQQGTEGPLQQAGILPQQGIEQTPVLLCKPAFVQEPHAKFPSLTALHSIIQLCRLETGRRL